MGDDDRRYRTYGDYKRARGEYPAPSHHGGFKRERKAPPRFVDRDPPPKRPRPDHGLEMPGPSTSSGAEFDSNYQPCMMSFKAFLETQDDTITDDEALSKYAEYKQEFKRQQLNEFFVTHKEEEWFRVKYHPVDLATRKAEQANGMKKRVDIFMEFFNAGKLKELQLDVDRETELVRLLDTVVVKLEDGTAEDIQHLSAEEEGGGEHKCLHKTSSIHLRTLPPTIKKQEIEALCKKFPGFLRVSLSDPAPEKKWFRRGWVSFERDAKIKEICYSLGNTRIRECDLGPVLNKDLSRRIRPVSLLANDRKVMRADIKLASMIISNFDSRWSLWEVKQRNELLGDESTNPVLENITEYLIEEASAEEDELLGFNADGDDQDKCVNLSRDEDIVAVLDRMILYLRIVHSFDFYSLTEYSNEDEMPNRCGILNVRDQMPSEQVTQTEIDDYIEIFKKKASTVLSTMRPLSDDETGRLGMKVEEDEIEKFIQAQTQELGKDKWLCTLSNKKFKGAEFVRKHIFNKHMEKVEAVKHEVEFFNNFLKDPRRPKIPEPPKTKPQPRQAPAEPRGEKRPAAEFSGGEEMDRPRGGPYSPPQRKKGSIKDRLGFKPQAMRVTHAASDPRGMVDYSDVDFAGEDLF